MKTISILGSGWLGLPLAAALAEQAYRVKVSTTSTHRLAELGALALEPFIVDIDSLNPVDPDFLQSEILIVNIPSKNIEGFSRLLTEIEKSSVDKVLFISSTSVYPDINKIILESDQAESADHPLTLIENLFRNCPQLQTTVLRFGGLIGYRRNPGRFLRPGHPVANPDATVNLIHRDDCIGIITQIIRQQAWGNVFNACADTHPTRREFYTQATTALGLAAPAFIAVDKQPFKIISNQKLKQVLGYDFVHPDLMQIRFEQDKADF